MDMSLHYQDTHKKFMKYHIKDMNHDTLLKNVIEHTLHMVYNPTKSSFKTALTLNTEPLVDSTVALILY